MPPNDSQQQRGRLSEGGKSLLPSPALEMTVSLRPLGTGLQGGRSFPTDFL